MGMTEAISKYNILGNDYVKLDELNDLIRDMKKKAMAGTEPGYIEPDEAKRTSAMLSLNHLAAVLNKEKCEEKLHKRLACEASDDETPGEYMVYRPGKKLGDGTFRVFERFENGNALIARDGGKVFAYEGMARRVAETLGDEWKVVDISQKAVEKTEKMLSAILDRLDEND